ncbi:hypothetical protein M422DRAFT_44594 [Sphaerobolus stellatus SS14]|nr:hypothetical protein M422DRAFT_44594 [Sphaerobolus stellatus SS14]
MYLLPLFISFLSFISFVSALPHRAPKPFWRPDLDLQERSDIKSQVGTLHIFTTQVACGTLPTAASSALIVALPPADFESGQNCLQPITINVDNKAVTALVVDECSDCLPGGLGMSEGLFNSLGLPISDTGGLEVTWSFTELSPVDTAQASGSNAGETVSNEIVSRDLINDLWRLFH